MTAQALTATRVDLGTDGWAIYHLSRFDGRDTIRVGAYNRMGDYRIEILRNNGWTHLAEGRYRDDVPYPEGVERAVAILFTGESKITWR